MGERGAPHHGLLNAIAVVLRADATATKTEVRVRGYPPSFMLLDADYAKVKHKPRHMLRDVSAADVKVQSSTHMAVSGLE